MTSDQYEAPPGANDTDEQVWYRESDDSVGFRRTIEAGGLMAAPVLAGFSFILLVLLLPELRGRAPAGTRGVSASVSEPFSAAPGAAAALLVAAGVIFIFTLQAAMHARQLGVSPAELMDWEAHRVYRLEHVPKLGQATHFGWEPRDLFDRTVDGRLRRRMYEYSQKEKVWLKATRWLYNLGIAVLLAGLATLLWPPSPDDSPEQLVGALIAIAAFLGELLWIFWEGENWSLSRSP